MLDYVYKKFNFKNKNMDPEILQKLEAQDKKLDAIYISAEKTRKYILWTGIITVVTIVVPLIILAFIIPWFLSVMSSAYSL